jgi:hypothetical protein
LRFNPRVILRPAVGVAHAQAVVEEYLSQPIVDGVNAVEGAVQYAPTAG